MLAWLCVWVKVQICIWPRWCHCHSLFLAAVNPDWFTFLVLAFCCWLTQVVLDKIQEGRKMVVCMYLCMYVTAWLTANASCNWNIFKCVLIDSGAQSDSEVTETAVVADGSSDRGYTSDSELYDTPKHDSVLSSSDTKLKPSSGSWLMVSLATHLHLEFSLLLFIASDFLHCIITAVSHITLKYW